MLYKRAFRKEKEVVTFLIKALNVNLAIFWQLLAWQAPMLVGKIGKAFEPSHRRPARDLGKQCRQDQEEGYGEDRGEHRGASRGTGGNGFLTVLIAGSRSQRN